jgi:hypothetical protein
MVKSEKPHRYVSEHSNDRRASGGPSDGKLRDTFGNPAAERCGFWLRGDDLLLEACQHSLRPGEDQPSLIESGDIGVNHRTSGSAAATPQEVLQARLRCPLLISF